MEKRTTAEAKRTITEILNEMSEAKNALAAYEEALANLGKHRVTLAESNAAVWALKDPEEEVVSDDDILKIDIEDIMAAREKRAIEVAVKRSANKLLNRRTTLLERECEDTSQVIWDCISPVIQKRRDQLTKEVQALSEQIEIIEHDWQAEAEPALRAFKINSSFPAEKAFLVTRKLLEEVYRIPVFFNHPGTPMK
ncbi:MAG: hypothetical protein WCJ37_02550 [Syntrophus sp. (in: bacteria)]